MLNAKLSAKETKVNMTGTKILANMFSQPPPPPLSTLPALLWRFLFTYFWSCAVLIRKMGDKEEDGKNSGETIKNWAKKNWGRGDQRSARARRGAGGKERERREKLNESGVEVVRKMVAHGSMNRPVKGREAQGICDSNFCRWSLGDFMKFFAAGITFYPWMPHYDKTGCYKVALL